MYFKGSNSQQNQTNPFADLVVALLACGPVADLCLAAPPIRPVANST